MQQDRPEGVFHLLGGNLNSALSREVRNRKISDIMRVIETWDAQAGGFLEVGIVWQNMARSKQINSWFRLGTDSYCTSVANNHQEAVPTMTRQQEASLYLLERKSGNTSQKRKETSEASAAGTCGLFNQTQAIGPGWWWPIKLDRQGRKGHKQSINNTQDIWHNTTYRECLGIFFRMTS
jgi:hypothetical protein